MPTAISLRPDLAADDLADGDFLVVHDISGTPTDRKYQAGGLKPWVLAASPWKAPVRVRTTANVNLAGGGLADGTTHDGETVATGDRVLVASQTAPAENGIYTVPASGAASRSFDAASADQLIRAAVKVRAGTYAGWTYTCTADPITLGTTAITWDTDAPLVASAVSLSGTYASRPSAGTAGRLYLPTDAPWISMCRDNGSTWDDYDGGLKLTPPPTSGWTWVNQNQAIRTDEKGGILLSASGAGGASCQSIIRNIPAAPWTITFGIVAWLGIEANISTGGGIYNTSSGNSQASFFNTIGNGIRYYIQRGTSNLVTFSTLDRNPYGIIAGKVVYFRVTDDGTNRSWWTSPDGVTWSRNGVVQANTTHLSSPTDFFFGIIANLANYDVKSRLVHYEVV